MSFLLCRHVGVSDDVKKNNPDMPEPVEDWSGSTPQAPPLGNAKTSTCKGRPKFPKLLMNDHFLRHAKGTMDMRDVCPARMASIVKARHAPSKHRQASYPVSHQTTC